MSGYEAERQRNDIQQFGREVACKLAERRAEYAKRRMAQMEKESLIIEVRGGRILECHYKIEKKEVDALYTSPFQCISTHAHKDSIENALYSSKFV